MTILSDNPSNSTSYSSPICGEFSNNSNRTSESNLMLSSPMMITSSVVEQAALYYSPLLTAATCYSVLERNHEDNMIALDEGSNISAQSIHNNNHHYLKEDSMHFDEYIDECAQSIQSDSDKPPQQQQEYPHRPCSFMDIKDFTSVTHNQNGAKNLEEKNCTPVYNNETCLINYPITPKAFNRAIDHHPPTFNKLCIPSHMTSVSTKNNKSLQNNTLSNFQPSTQYKVFDHHEHPLLNHNKSTFCEEALSSPQCNDPFSYQHFQNNQFSLPDQNLLVPQENPQQPLMIINNIDQHKQQQHHYHHQTKKQDNSYAHEDSQVNNNDNITPLSGSAAYNSQNSSICTFTSGSSHHQEEYRNSCCSLLTTEQEENPATNIDSQQEDLLEVFSTVLPSSSTNNNNTKGRTTSTTTMGNTIINHYFPNDVHPGLGFIEMLPNKYQQQQQQQQNNNRLSSSFHHHQYAVNYDHHQTMMVNSPTMMKEMMVLDEKNMTTTLTHSSSHSSLTHLSRFNGDVKQFISGSATAATTDEPSLIDLPFEMILHIITFIPHQDNMCHEYNTYCNVREKYLKKLHTEAKQSVHNQFSKKRFVKNLMESTQTNRISISSKDDEMDDEYQYMSQTNYGIFSICFVNNYMYHNYFKNVHFWKLICESYFNIPRTDCLEPPVDKKLLNAIYSKQFNGASDCPTSKIAKLGDWLQGMLNISNASEFSNLAIDENMGSFQVTGAVQNSGSNANFFISNPPVQEELVWWQYSYHYLHSVPARFDLNPNYLLPIFQVNPKNACSEDSNMLNISGLAKENDITKNSVLYNTCISRLMETDNKKSPNDYRWRNATSEQIFTPNNLYYFEFYVEKIGGINLGVGIVPNIHFTGSDNTDAPKDFNPSHYDNFIWPSGSCHHCFEINNQRYYSGDVVGMLVDYSYSEKNVLKIHFCHNWNTKEKRKMLQNQLKKVAELETLCHSTGNFEQSVFSSLLEDEINNIRNGVKSKDNEDEDDINYPFKDNQVRLIYFTDDTQTQFPECVISEGRNELISFMKVNPATHNPTDKKKKEAPKKLDLQKERPQASHKDLTLPDFKLCVTTYDKEDSVRIIKPSYPHPPLYYHLLRNGRHTQQQTPANKPILSSTEEKELRKIIMDALGDCQYSSKNHHQHTNSSSSSNSSNSSSEERNKGCSIM